MTTHNLMVITSVQGYCTCGGWGIATAGGLARLRELHADHAWSFASPEPTSQPAAAQTFTCPACGLINRHPDDVRSGYCTGCGDWTGRPTGLDIVTPEDADACRACDGRGEWIEIPPGGSKTDVVVRTCAACGGLGAIALGGVA